MPKVSEEHAAARRSQILDAAIDCFARTGIHRTTMRDVFRESGLSPGAVYTYFFGKDDLVRAVAERVLEMPSLDARAGRVAIQLWAEALFDPMLDAAAFAAAARQLPARPS